MPLLKNTVVSIRIIYEIIKQHASVIDELNDHLGLVVEIESVVLKMHEESHHQEALTILLSGLEQVLDGFKKLDANIGKVFFRAEPLIEKLHRFLQKLCDVSLRIQETLPIEDQSQEDNLEHLNLLDLCLHPTAAEFWKRHFGEHTDKVTWEVFREAFEKDFHETNPENIKRLKKLLGCNTSEDLVSLWEFADFTDAYGLDKSYYKLTQRSSSLLSPPIERSFSSEMSVEEIIPIEDPTPQSPTSPYGDKQELNHPVLPFQVNAVWKGVSTEHGCEAFDMCVHITEREDEKMKGEILWAVGDVLTRFRGHVQDELVQFEEYKVVKGVGIIPFPNKYVGKWDKEDNTIIGKWYYNDQEGKFHLHFDEETTKMLSIPEVQPMEDMPPILLEGYLNKQAAHGIQKKWQSRYFVCQDGLVMYSKSKEGYTLKKIRETIPMTHMISVQEDPESQRPNSFEIISSERTYHLQAENPEQKEKWMSVLKQELRKYKTDNEEIYNLN